MADINHTKIPNLSIATTDSSAGSTAFLEVPSTASFNCAGVASFTGAVQLGSNGTSFAALRASTVSVAIGGTAGDSVTTSVTIPNIAVGDPIVAIVPASIWSGAYRDLSLDAYASAASTVLLGARNSTTTAVNTAAMNFTFYWLDLA